MRYASQAPDPPWEPPPGVVVQSKFKRPRRPRASPVCGRRRLQLSRRAGLRGHASRAAVGHGGTSTWPGVATPSQPRWRDR